MRKGAQRLWPVLLLACAGADTGNPCARQGAHVHVLTDAHTLSLCEGTARRRVFDVRLAWGGVGKRAEGDGKVPLGTYALGRPRRSAKFGSFIPVGYPTARQRAEGYTGGAIGLHGPSRELRWLGRANNWLDTTDGCIAVASDAEMKQLADWVGASHAAVIVID